MQIVSQTDIPVYPLLARGKVRDIYDVSEHSLLIVTTDRMSAFDVVLPTPIPYKGVVLNRVTRFWMRRFEGLIGNHLLTADATRFPKALHPYLDILEGRSALVKKAAPLPVECVVRGYLSGSGLKDYRATGMLCGHRLPEGLVEASRLPAPIFTPSTKAAPGEHDENLTREQAAALLGRELAERVENLSLQIFQEASAYAANRGIIVADTKFEFGMVDGELTLIDEVLTPDSSRFWPAEGYGPGRAQPSFDKQYLRDWLETQTWNKQSPGPALPDEVAEVTGKKYREAYTAFTGETLPL